MHLRVDLFSNKQGVNLPCAMHTKETIKETNLLDLLSLISKCFDCKMWERIFPLPTFFVWKSSILTTDLKIIPWKSIDSKLKKNHRSRWVVVFASRLTFTSSTHTHMYNVCLWGLAAVFDLLLLVYLWHHFRWFKALYRKGKNTFSKSDFFEFHTFNLEEK